MINSREYCNKTWLNRKVFDWKSFSGGGTIQEKEELERAYQIWEHASHLIIEGKNDFQLSDGLLNLKRSVNHRLKLIEKYYKFNSIENMPKGYFEKLEVLGIVRPFIMKQLLSIRNSIEHNDTPPPDKERCTELLDVVWYFLKSTDSIVQIMKKEINYELFDSEGHETAYGYSITLDYENIKEVSFSGWFPIEYLSSEPQKNFIQVEVKELHGPEKWRNTKYHKDKIETDKWIVGNIIYSDDDIKKMIPHILSTY